MTDQKNRETPYCFGKLDQVFPMTDSGFRESPESCRVCLYKTECLRTAMQTPDGAIVKQEALDRAYASGMVGFWTRWSRKKALQRKMKSRSTRRQS